MRTRARRVLVPDLVSRGVSYRRSCVLLSVSRSGLGYESLREGRDKDLISQLRAIARRHPSFGYRRAWALLRRKGVEINRKRVYRLWKLAGLDLPRRRGYRRYRSGRRVVPEARAANEVWASDIVCDSISSGGRIRCLTVLDEYTRECLAIAVGRSMRSERVVEVLEGLAQRYGRPRYLRTDNGSEFRSHVMGRWMVDRAVEAAFIDPGKPWQNGMVESFHSSLRRECLNREFFGSVEEARVVIEQYRRHYNEIRPHSSIGYCTPSQMRVGSDTICDSASPRKNGEKSRLSHFEWSCKRGAPQKVL